MIDQNKTAEPYSLAKELKARGLFYDFGALIYEQETKYEEALDWLVEHNIQRGSLAAIHRFKERQRSAWFLARGKRVLEETGDMLPDEISEMERNFILQRCFDAAVNPTTSLKDLMELRRIKISEGNLRAAQEKLKQAERRLEQQQTEIEFKQRRIEALEAQAANARAALDKASLHDGGVTPETVAAIREAFGMSKD